MRGSTWLAATRTIRPDSPTSVRRPSVASRDKLAVGPRITSEAVERFGLLAMTPTTSSFAVAIVAQGGFSPRNDIATGRTVLEGPQTAW